LSDLLVNLFWTVPVGVFVAGFIGSPHCVAMCGPLVFSFARDKRSLALYQIGRMFTYVLAGVVFGAAGNTILTRLNNPLVASLAIGTFTLLLVVLGIRFWRREPLHLTMPPLISKATLSLLRVLRIQRAPNFLISFVAGATTVLLPCGHLYSFLIGAAATGSALGGAIFMFAFWLSTVPALALSPMIARRVFNTQFLKAPRLAGALLIASGLISLASFAGRMQISMSEPAKAAQSHKAHSCH
jgi:uncharacterized protein